MRPYPPALQSLLETTNWAGFRQSFTPDGELLQEQLRNLLSPDPVTRRTAASFVCNQGAFDGDLKELGFFVLPFVLYALSDGLPDHAKADVYEMLCRMMSWTYPATSEDNVDVDLDGRKVDLLTGFRNRIASVRSMFVRDSRHSDPGVAREASIICEVLDEWALETMTP